MKAPHRMIRHSRIVALHHPITPSIPFWPGDPPVCFETVATPERDGYFLRRFSMSEHAATHINAPRCFYPDGPGVESYPPEALVVPGAVLDIRHRAQADPDARLEPADIASWEQQHGPLPPGALVLLRTGWDRRWNDPVRYINADERGVGHFPGFSTAAAQLLLEQAAVAGLGSDTPGIEPGQDVHFSVNRLMLAKNRLVLENLTGLDQLPAVGFTVFIGLLALSGGSGSPCSVLALCP